MGGIFATRDTAKAEKANTEAKEDKIKKQEQKKRKSRVGLEKP